MTAYITGLGLVTGAESTDGRSLDELVFTAAAYALADAGIDREMVDGVCLGASDQLDARAISSMQLAGPAGGFLRDEIRVSDDGSTALAAAALRVEAGVSKRVLATSWTKASESPYDGAVGVNAEPILARPAALHPWATEALVTTRFASEFGIDIEEVDALAAQLGASNDDDWVCTPLRRSHIPPPTDAAIAMVVESEPGDGGVELAGLAWATSPGDGRASPEETLSAIANVAGAACVDAELELSADVPVETTDRTVWRLCMTVAGLGLAAPSAAASALRDGQLPNVNAAGGLWLVNPVFAAGLERVLAAVGHVRSGAPAALAHSSYGSAGQGQFVAVIRAL